MTYIVPLGVFLISLATLPLLYTLTKVDSIKKSQYLLFAPACCLALVLGGTTLLFHRYFRRVDVFMFVFSSGCWIGVVSLFLGLELDGYISKFIGHFGLEDEPYLKTAYGTMMGYFDGTLQLLLSLAIIALYSHRQSHRELSLYWAGACLNSVLVLIPGAIIGPHKVTMMIMGHVICLVAAFLVVAKYLHRSPIQARSFVPFPAVWKRPVDLLFVIFFSFAAVWAIYRLLAVLGGNVSCMKDLLKSGDPYLKDSNMFPKIQTLTYGYFFLAYYVVTIYGLLFPGQHWMADWAFIHAGAALQAQISFVGGAFNHRTAKGLRPPSSGADAYIYWIANILLLVVPQLFAYWCHRDPDTFGRTYTLDLVQPLKTYVVRSVTTTTTHRSEYSQRKSD